MGGAVGGAVGGAMGGAVGGVMVNHTTSFLFLLLV